MVRGSAGLGPGGNTGVLAQVLPVTTPLWPAMTVRVMVERQLRMETFQPSNIGKSNTTEVGGQILERRAPPESFEM